MRNKLPTRSKLKLAMEPHLHDPIATANPTKVSNAVAFSLVKFLISELELSPSAAYKSAKKDKQ